MALNSIRKALHTGKLKVDFEDNAPWPMFTPEDRLQTFRKCGSVCFMRASDDLSAVLKDPKSNLKFPVCRPPAPRSRSCALSAAGLLAANRRARLTKKYPDVVQETSTLIKQLGTTKKARAQQKKIVKARISPLPDGKFNVVLVYEDKVKEHLPEPLSKKVVLKRYASVLPKTHLKLLQ